MSIPTLSFQPSAGVAGIMRAAAFPPRVGRRPLIDLVFFDAGGGHRATAIALEAVLARERPTWKVRLVNLRDVLDSIDVFRRITRVRAEQLYNRLLRYDVTIGIGTMLPLLHLLVRRMHRQQVQTLTRFWRQAQPDLVLSVIPHFNRAIFDSLRQAASSQGRRVTPLATILTDLADYPPNFWIEQQQQYLICGTARAAAQARALGHHADRVFRTSGMVVRPEFYEPLEVSREFGRTRLGLDPYLPTGIVLFGGFGSRRMLTIANRLAKVAPKTQLIFICGHNQRLRRQIVAMRLPIPHHVVGFTRDVSYFMRLADYFIGKPGPGSLSEAIVTGLPVIVERNARTMVQERYNTDWILENRVGVVLRSFARVESGIAAMLDPGQLAGFRARVAAIGNRAVFEIPQILDELMFRAEDSSGYFHGPGRSYRSRRGVSWAELRDGHAGGISADAPTIEPLR